MLTTYRNSLRLLLQINRSHLEQQKNELLPGTLNLMALKTLSALGSLHGYGIARRIEQIIGGKHMIWLRLFIHRLCGLFLKRKMERELEDEIRSHLDMQIEDNLRLGMSPEEARYEALRKFGGVEQVKERYRDRSSLSSVDSTLQDLRYGLRMLWKNKGFTAIAVLSLALGIGANTAIFSLVDTVLIKMLPVKNPEQLVFLEGPMRTVSYAFYEQA